MPFPRSFLGLLALLVLIPRIGPAQSVFSPCLSNPSNDATVMLPASLSAAIGPSDADLDGGPTPDSIAVFTPDGTCVGVSAWSDSDGVALSIAGSGPLVSDGLSPSDSLQYRVYDASRGVVDEVLVEYTSCASTSATLQPLCHEGRAYQKDAVYVPAALGSYSLALQIEGTPGADGADAGWRFVGPPTGAAIPAEDLRLGDEAPSFNLNGDMLATWNDDASSGNGPTGAYEGGGPSDELQPGRGYALYLFDQSPYAVDPTLTIDVAGSPAVRSDDSVSVTGLAQTARWHLLANPYPSGYDLSGLSDLVSNGFQSTVQRYDATTESWVLEAQSDTRLAGWQAFFIERTDVGGGAGATSLTFSPQGRIVDAPFVGSKTNAAPSRRRATIGLSLQITNSAGDTTNHDRAAQVVFDDRASADWDAFDATKLTPLSSSYVLLAPQGRGRTDSLIDKSVESRSWPSTAQSVPVRLRSQNLDAETATLSVSRWSLPASWNAQLVDQHRGTTHPLDSTAALSIPLSPNSTRNASRFSLRIAPSDVGLPLDLARLQAVLDDRAVRLEWDPENEPTTGFSVERRTVTDTTAAASSSWTEIGTVEHAESSEHTYRFRDDDLPYEATQYTYRLRQVDPDGTVHHSDTVQVNRERVDAPTLQRSFPNPAHTTATIRYALPEAQHIRLEMYDLLGRRIRLLADAHKRAGRHQYTLDTSRLPSGTYFYRLQAGDTTITRKATVVH